MPCTTSTGSFNVGGSVPWPAAFPSLRSPGAEMPFGAPHNTSPANGPPPPTTATTAVGGAERVTHEKQRCARHFGRDEIGKAVGIDAEIGDGSGLAEFALAQAVPDVVEGPHLDAEATHRPAEPVVLAAVLAHPVQEHQPCSRVGGGPRAVVDLPGHAGKERHWASVTDVL